MKGEGGSNRYIYIAMKGEGGSNRYIYIYIYKAMKGEGGSKHKHSSMQVFNSTPSVEHEH